MNGFHVEHFTVRHREADRRGDLRLAGWFDFLQEAAANHAARLGVGLDHGRQLRQPRIRHSQLFQTCHLSDSVRQRS